MNAPSTSLLQDLKRQELIAKDKLRAEQLLKSMQAMLASKPEVSKVDNTKAVRGT